MGNPYSCALVSAALLLAPSVTAQTFGHVIAADDDWTLADTGFSRAPDTTRFVQNIAQQFTGGSPGNFLVYARNFGLIQSKLAAAMTTAGHQWTVSTTVRFDTPTLRAFDAVFLGGATTNPPPARVLIDYVESGGNVYVLAGTGTIGSPTTEAAAWNPFLTHFGLAFAGTFNGSNGVLPVMSSHALFNGVSGLYHVNGQDVSTVTPQAGTSMALDQGRLGIAAVPTSPLDLQITPSPVGAGQVLTFAASGGVANFPLVIVADTVSGIAVPLALITTATLDAQGSFSVGVPIPAGLSGFTLGMFAATPSPSFTAIAQSPRVTVTFS